MTEEETTNGTRVQARRDSKPIQFLRLDIGEKAGRLE